jgi:predicted RNA polymerase sigma factor
MIERLREDRAKRDFERFAAGATDDLLRTAYLVVWDLPDAEDLVQESLVRVAKRWPPVGSMDHPVAYAGASSSTWRSTVPLAARASGSTVSRFRTSTDQGCAAHAVRP